MIEVGVDLLIENVGDQDPEVKTGPNQVGIEGADQGIGNEMTDEVEVEIEEVDQERDGKENDALIVEIEIVEEEIAEIGKEGGRKLAVDPLKKNLK